MYKILFAVLCTLHTSSTVRPPLRQQYGMGVIIHGS